MKNHTQEKATTSSRYEAPNLKVIGNVSTLTLGKRRGNADDGSGAIFKHWVFTV